MSGDLNNVSYVTLALIGKGGASPQDLVEMHRSAAQIYYAVAPSRIQNGAIAKLISGDIAADDARLLEALLTLRGEIDAQEAKLDHARERLAFLPHRRRYLLLADNLGRRWLRVQREWLDDVERELGPD